MIVLRRPSLLAWLLLLSGLVLFVNLGIWQHSRAEHKRERLHGWAQAQQHDEIPWRSDAPHLTAVSMRGQWLPQRYLLDNVIREGRTGVDVFAPLRGDAGMLLVALGWLPYADGLRQLPELPPLPDDGSLLHGIWVPVPAHGIRMGRDWARVSSWPKLMPYFDLSEMAADAGIDPANGVLRLADQPDSGYRRDWHPVDGMPPERHLAYAWQWWSLAVAIVVVFVVVHSRRRNRK